MISPAAGARPGPPLALVCCDQRRSNKEMRRDEIRWWGGSHQLQEPGLLLQLLLFAAIVKRPTVR